MADECGSSGLFARIAFDTSATGALANFTASSDAFPLAGNTTLSLKRAHVNNEGTNGTTTQSSELTRVGLDIVDGDIPFLLTPNWLQYFAPLVTGRTFTGFQTYPAVAEPPQFHAMLHRDAALYVYQDLRVNTFTVGSTSGETVNASIGVIGRGREETPADPSNWPVALLTDKSVPYMHHDVSITVNGTAHKFRSWSLTFNANLAPVYFGSTKPCRIKRNGRTSTTLQLVGPHTADTIAQILHAAEPPAAMSVTITLTHPTPAFSASFTLPAVQVPPQDPPTAEGEILLDLTGTARTKTGTLGEMIIQNDNL